MEAKTIGIIGGGISGLSAQHFASRAKSPYKVATKLYERGKRVGGWMETGRRTFGPNNRMHMFEKGPRSIRGAAAGNVTLGLVAEAGLVPRLLHPTKNAGKRLLYMHGRIVKVPQTLKESLTSPLLPYLPAFAWDFILTRSTGSTEDESIASFLGRHIGKAATRDIVAGVVVGIYGGSVERLSMKSCFGAFHAATLRRGSFVRGLLLSNPTPSYVDEVATTLQMNSAERAVYEDAVKRVKAAGGMFTFADAGVDELPNKLRELHKNDIELGAELIGVSKNSTSSKLNLHFAPQDGKDRVVTVDRAIAAIPSFALAPTLASIAPNVSKMLADIEFVHMGLVSLAFEQAPGQQLIKPEHQGFGYLVSPAENRPILGISFDSLTFPTQSESTIVRMCVMIGGDLNLNKSTIDVSKTDHETLIKIAMDTVRSDLQITAQPISTDVFIAKNAIPQYTVGHVDRVKYMESLLKKEIPQLDLAGASYYGLGVNDCAFSGMRAAQSSIRQL